MFLSFDRKSLVATCFLKNENIQLKKTLEELSSKINEKEVEMKKLCGDHEVSLRCKDIENKIKRNIIENLNVKLDEETKCLTLVRTELHQSNQVADKWEKIAVEKNNENRELTENLAKCKDIIRHRDAEIVEKSVELESLKSKHALQTRSEINALNDRQKQLSIDTGLDGRCVTKHSELKSTIKKPKKQSSTTNCENEQPIVMDKIRTRSRTRALNEQTSKTGLRPSMMNSENEQPIVMDKRRTRSKTRALNDQNRRTGLRELTNQYKK